MSYKPERNFFFFCTADVSVIVRDSLDKDDDASFNLIIITRVARIKTNTENTVFSKYR